MKQVIVSIIALACATARAVIVTVGPWTPIFQGIDLASGQQQKQIAGEQDHQVRCLRIDLLDPDVRLFTTPHCTNGCSFETLAENTSFFLEEYGLQAVINGGFYSSSAGPNDSPFGTAEDVFGLAISKGNVVSTANNSSYAAALLFTTNNVPYYVPTNSPGTNTAGMYTAISGNYALLINGVNVGISNPSDLDPRTAIGLSQDRRYLYLMTLGGRQTGWSDGADFFNTAAWLQRFGAYQGINIDGGGSTTMSIADCQGKAIRVNRSSFVAAYGRERNIGHNFGVYARSLPTDLKNLTVQPGSTTAIITWRTDSEATTQVEYGPTSSYGSNTFDGRLLKKHAATLSSLSQGSNYFFRAISTTAGGQQQTQACSFTTLTSLSVTQVFGLTKSWSYTTQNLDSVNWKTNGYDDSGWLGSGSGLLYVLETSAAVAPKNTAMPPLSGMSIPRTYYFRTHFNFSGSIAGASLVLSNYVDDGAVFHLNGAEVYRLRMPAAPAAITYTTFASSTPCTGTAQAGDAANICPDVFTISGNLLTNLVQGDNVLAVEVHNYSTGTDLVFGSALIQNTPLVVPPRLNLWMENNQGTLFWNGAGFTLQRSSNISSPANWSDVPGAATQSPFTITNGLSSFYRLRN